MSCKYIGSRKGKVIKCYVCGKEKYKPLKLILRTKSGKLFCGKSCQTKWRNTEFVGNKHGNWKNGRNAYRSVLGRHGIEKICFMCKNENSKVLAVHHIDKNRANNDLNNLVWVCHNCHHLIHHDSVYEGKFQKKLARG